MKAMTAWSGLSFTDNTQKNQVGKLIFRTPNRTKREADYYLILITKVQGDTDLLLTDSEVNDQLFIQARDIQGSEQKYVEWEAPTPTALEGHKHQPSPEFMPPKMGQSDAVWPAVLLEWKGSHNSVFGHMKKITQET